MVPGKMSPLRFSYPVCVIHVKVHINHVVVHSAFEKNITRSIYSEFLADSPFYETTSKGLSSFFNAGFFGSSLLCSTRLFLPRTMFLYK